MEELEETIKLFNDQKENITNLIMNFEPLSSRSKKEMMEYIEQFYKIINNKKSVETEFIKNARTQ
jgi:succinate dehydrogenase flavin-adding protein (antitoxin of CptAB toxin-antitoxin module)